MNDAIQLPAWCRLFQPRSRYKVAWGGRGSGKSWGFARMLLLRVGASPVPVRVLCARELQVSIRDSVHRLLADQIDAMGIGHCFDVGESFIRCSNGSEFLFKGLRHNAGEIKSMENISICWIEEAQAVSEDSWKLLIPTIRAPGSEIWVTFNPDQESDPTYKRFVLSPPPSAIVRRVNWHDNPWFPPELEAERRHMQETDLDAYNWVWEGECRRVSDAQVLRGKWIVEPFTSEVSWDGPYFGADWGFSVDPTALVKLWIHDECLYVEHEAYGVGVEIDHLPAMFDKVPGSRERIVRADSARPETISFMRRQGFKMEPAEKYSGSVEEGVEFLRSFKRIVIHPRCKHTAEEAKLWSYKTDRLTGDVLPVLKDAHNHCWDGVRYALAPAIKAKSRGALGPITFRAPHL